MEPLVEEAVGRLDPGAVADRTQAGMLNHEPPLPHGGRLYLCGAFLL
ncbi:MAG: hypothetical protein IPK63_23470 [Candidatus Competibacteraceae bacterium]|nr:hypothetical protein [Candidatus Competibacteraceae bacterium]